MPTQLKSAKAAVAAATFAALLAGGTAAAAVTGSLPNPAQSAVSGALAHVGVSVPGSSSHADGHATNRKAHRALRVRDETAGDSGATDPKNDAQGPDATGNAEHGLCQAWAATPTPNAHSHKRDSVAFTNLQEAADAAGMSVAGFCKDTTPHTGGDATPATPSRDTTKSKHSKPEKVRPTHAPDTPRAPRTPRAPDTAAAHGS
jgi:hypothetical protein